MRPTCSHHALRPFHHPPPYHPATSASSRASNDRRREATPCRRFILCPIPCRRRGPQCASSRRLMTDDATHSPALTAYATRLSASIRLPSIVLSTTHVRVRLPYPNGWKQHGTRLPALVDCLRPLVIKCLLMHPSPRTHCRLLEPDKSIPFPALVA